MVIAFAIFPTIDIGTSMMVAEAMLICEENQPID